MKNGAHGYLLKNDGDALVDALKQIYNGGKYFSERVVQKILDKNSETKDRALKLESKILLQDVIRSSYSELTRQEKEILKLMAEDCSKSEIKKNLNISCSTFRVHTHKMRAKLKVKTTKDLIRYSKAIN